MNRFVFGRPTATSDTSANGFSASSFFLTANLKNPRVNCRRFEIVVRARFRSVVFEAFRVFLRDGRHIAIHPEVVDQIADDLPPDFLRRRLGALLAGNERIEELLERHRDALLPRGDQTDGGEPLRHVFRKVRNPASGFCVDGAATHMRGDQFLDSPLDVLRSPFRHLAQADRVTFSIGADEQYPSPTTAIISN
jgi:hypothetical protein